MRRYARVLLLAGLLLGGATPAQAWEDWQVSDALTQASQQTGVSRRLLRCLSWEESEWNPWAVGRAGELGLFQLHPRGLLPDFYAAGFDDPFDPYQSALFTARMLDAGLGRMWTPIRWGWC